MSKDNSEQDAAFAVFVKATWLGDEADHGRIICLSVTQELIATSEGGGPVP
jgi:hypothetical protein